MPRQAPPHARTGNVSGTPSPQHDRHNRILQVPRHTPRIDIVPQIPQINTDLFIVNPQNHSVVVEKMTSSA